MLTTSGLGGMLTGWPHYAVIAATVSGTLLQQAALHVGPLSVCQLSSPGAAWTRSLQRGWRSA